MLRRGAAEALPVPLPVGELLPAGIGAILDSRMASSVPTGAVVAGFRVESLLGRGAMAEVYRARDETTGRPVALKLLDESLLDDERFRRRFLREADLAGTLVHPNIVATL